MTSSNRPLITVTDIGEYVRHQSCGQRFSGYDQTFSDSDRPFPLS